MIKRILVKNPSTNNSASETSTTPQQATSNPKVTKRVIVRRIIRQGDTTREVIMNPDGTLIDPAELARLPQGNVVKRVVVKKPLENAQHIAAMLQSGDSKQYLKLEGEEMQKLIKSVPASTGTNTVSNAPKVLAVQRLEPSQNISQIIAKDHDQENKEKILVEELQKTVEKQRLKIEELQAKKQLQQDYDNDEMLPERHDDGSDEEPQLPLKRVFVKRKQCIYDEEKEYNNSDGSKKQQEVKESSADVDEMSQELCNLLESSETTKKMQETIMSDLQEITNNTHQGEVQEEMQPQEEQQQEEEEQQGENSVKITIEQNDEDCVKLQFEDSTQENNTQEEMETSDMFENSEQAIEGEEKAEVENMEQSVIELSATNETINLNETTDSRDSLEDKLSQMEGWRWKEKV